MTRNVSMRDRGQNGSGPGVHLFKAKFFTTANL